MCYHYEHQIPKYLAIGYMDPEGFRVLDHGLGFTVPGLGTLRLGGQGSGVDVELLRPVMSRYVVFLEAESSCVLLVT